MVSLARQQMYHHVPSSLRALTRTTCPCSSLPRMAPLVEGSSRKLRRAADIVPLSSPLGATAAGAAGACTGTLPATGSTLLASVGSNEVGRTKSALTQPLVVVPAVQQVYHQSPAALRNWMVTVWLCTTRPTTGKLTPAPLRMLRRGASTTPFSLAGTSTVTAVASVIGAVGSTTGAGVAVAAGALSSPPPPPPPPGSGGGSGTVPCCQSPGPEDAQAGAPMARTSSAIVNATQKSSAMRVRVVRGAGGWFVCMVSLTCEWSYGSVAKMCTALSRHRTGYSIRNRSGWSSVQLFKDNVCRRRAFVARAYAMRTLQR